MAVPASLPAPALALTLPLALPLQLLSALLQRVFRIRPDGMTRAYRREAMAEIAPRTSYLVPRTSYLSYLSYF